MLLLALDTSTSAVTVAVHDGEQVLAEPTTLDTRRHTEMLTPSIRDAMVEAGRKPADLTAVAVGVGPGPFTGLRVGIATAATLGLVLDILVHGVCSLDVLAHEAAAVGAGPEFLVATDARRKEVYWARYTRMLDGVQRASGPEVSRPADLPAQMRSLPTAGHGPILYPEDFGTPLQPVAVSAGLLAAYALDELAAGRSLLPVRPLYLRQPDAKPTVAHKSVLPT